MPKRRCVKTIFASLRGGWAGATVQNCCFFRGIATRWYTFAKLADVIVGRGVVISDAPTSKMEISSAMHMGEMRPPLQSGLGSQRRMCDSAARRSAVPVQDATSELQSTQNRYTPESAARKVTIPTLCIFGVLCIFARILGSA